MGIHTKEFGETAYLRDGLTDKHWYNYLNALAEETEGVIISRNLAKMMEKEVGDSLVCEMNPPPQSTNTAPYANVSLKIVGIVDSWPGYEKYYYIKDDNGKLVEKERYLAIMNYGTAINSFTVLPYEIWGRIDSGFMGNAMTSDELKEKLSAGFTEKRRLDYINSWRDELREEKSTAIIQITNGLFTADFLIALILCIIGYMIYWITSIRDRELLFGIYRAMGISRGEINNMLGLEQIFLSLMSIFAGVLSGTLASKFFVKVFAAVYLPQRHNVTVFTSSYGSDMIKMGVVLLIVVVVCVFWIRRIVRSLNITEALKLGED
jgi:putative ABC transport system permease protein